MPRLPPVTTTVLEASPFGAHARSTSAGKTGWSKRGTDTIGLCELGDGGDPKAMLGGGGSGSDESVSGAQNWFPIFLALPDEQLYMCRRPDQSEALGAGFISKRKKGNYGQNYRVYPVG